MHEDFNLNHKLVFFGTQEQSFITEELAHVESCCCYDCGGRILLP
jgi:hypothetical protein